MPVFRSLLLVPVLAACVAQPGDDDDATAVRAAAATCDGDYCELFTFHFAAGGGFQPVALRSYCARSGYPDGVLEVTGLDPDDVIALPTDAGDVVLLGEPGDVALVRRYGERGEDCAVGVSSIHFADGTRWNTNRRRQGTPVPFDPRRVVEGGSGNDRLRGTRRVDALLGAAGNDRLYGYQEDDVLSGGAGDDRLYGYQGDDVLIDGPGDDLLAGDDGDDLYVIQNGGGVGGTETIDDSAGDIRLVLIEAYLHNDDEALFFRSADDLELTFSRAADRVVLRDYFRGDARLTAVDFDNLTVEGADLEARLRDATSRTPVLRYRDAQSGLLQASPDGYVSLGCAGGDAPATLGELDLAVLNVADDIAVRFREVANDCGDVARLRGDAIVGTSPPACPPAGAWQTCRVEVDAEVEGERTDVVTLEVYSAP